MMQIRSIAALMKGLNSQRELLKRNNLGRWRRSLELVACLDSNLFIGAVRLLVVSLIARIKHAVGAAIAGGSGCCFFRPFFCTHFCEVHFHQLRERVFYGTLTTGEDAQEVCFFEDEQSIGQSIF